MLLRGFCGGVGLGGSCLRIISLGFLGRLRVLDGLCLDSMADLILFIGFILFGWYSTMIFHSCHVPDYGHQLYYNSYTHQVQSPFQYIIIKLYISQTIKKSIMQPHQITSDYSDTHLSKYVISISIYHPFSTHITHI